MTHHLVAEKSKKTRIETNVVAWQGERNYVVAEKSKKTRIETQVIAPNILIQLELQKSPKKQGLKPIQYGTATPAVSCCRKVQKNKDWN